MFGFVLRNCRFIFLCLFLLIHERNNFFSIFIIFSLFFFSLYGSIRVRIVFILICYFYYYFVPFLYILFIYLFWLCFDSEKWTSCM